MNQLLKIAKKKSDVEEEKEDVQDQAKELGHALNKKKKGETKTNKEIDEEKEDVHDQKKELKDAKKKEKEKKASLIRSRLRK